MPGLNTLARQAATEGRSIVDYLSITRSILMNQLAREAELNRSYAVERVAGRLIEVLREIGAATGEHQRLTGAVFNVTNNVQILNSPLFAELQAGLLEVCAAYPDARAAIVALFRRLDAQHAPQAVSGAKLIESRPMEAAE
jgi:hypothetical protein